MKQMMSLCDPKENFQILFGPLGHTHFLTSFWTKPSSLNETFHQYYAFMEHFVFVFDIIAKDKCINLQQLLEEKDNITKSDDEKINLFYEIEFQKYCNKRYDDDL